jgi:NADH-quinone oxidoreductase subunit L
MGGLRKKLPITFWTMVTGAVAMAGVFPLSGFWAKDEIIGGAFNAGYYWVWAVGIVTAFVTAIYMGRLIFLTFWGENRAAADVQHHIHESAKVMTVPLVLLAIPAALLGAVVGLPPEGGWIHRFLEPVFFSAESESFSWIGSGGILMLVSLAVVLLGAYAAYVMYVTRRELPAELGARFPRAYRASFNKFYMDEFYEVSVVRPVIDVANWLWTFFDVKVIDGSVNGLAWLWDRLSRLIRPVQTGRVQNYALGIFAGMFVLVIVLRWVWGS